MTLLLSAAVKSMLSASMCKWRLVWYFLSVFNIISYHCIHTTTNSNFILSFFCGLTMFHCKNILASHLPDKYIDPKSSCCEQSCNKHGDGGFSLMNWFNIFWMHRQHRQQLNPVVILFSGFGGHFMVTLKYYSLSSGMWALPFAHSHLHLSNIVIFITAILCGMRCSHTVALICISLMASAIKHFFRYLLTNILLRNINSDNFSPFLIFHWVS